MADCLLTLDYELFFKKSGDAYLSLLKPTDDLLKVLEDTGGKAVFFVDTIYLNLLRTSAEPENLELYKKFEEQLRDIVARGHRIELHLHPHWLDARQVEREWVFQSYEHYKLNSLPVEKIQELFREGVECLNRIARQADPDYTVLAFRAGGWCVEPFEKIRAAFRMCGIKIDSSVVPGMRLDGAVHALDYTGLGPKAFYKFSDNVREPDERGVVIELPVNGYYLSRSEKLRIAIGRKFNRKKARIFGDGTGISIVLPVSYRERLTTFFRFGKYYNQFMLDGYIDGCLLEEKVAESSLPFVSMVAHPKTLTHSSLQAIRYLVQKGHRFCSLPAILQKYEM